MEDQLIAGATPGFVCLSVSIELIEGILADIEPDRAAEWQIAPISLIPQ